MIGIKRNTVGDISIKNGTLEIGDITEDVCELVMLSSSGEMKHAPTIGAGLVHAINGKLDPFHQQRINRMLQSEKLTNARLKVSGNDITVEL